MSGYGSPGSGAGGAGQSGVAQRIEEAVELIEMELRHAIAYVNDAVIPQVRKESIGAMRIAADTLRNLADRFERQAGESRHGGPGQENSGQDQSRQSQPGQNAAVENSTSSGERRD